MKYWPDWSRNDLIAICEALHLWCFIIIVTINRLLLPNNTIIPGYNYSWLYATWFSCHVGL